MSSNYWTITRTNIVSSAHIIFSYPLSLRLLQTYFNRIKTRANVQKASRNARCRNTFSPFFFLFFFFFCVAVVLWQTHSTWFPSCFFFHASYYMKSLCYSTICKLIMGLMFILISMKFRTEANRNRGANLILCTLPSPKNFDLMKVRNEFIDTLHV